MAGGAPPLTLPLPLPLLLQVLPLALALEFVALGRVAAEAEAGGNAEALLAEPGAEVGPAAEEART